jgi:hypothetical protein
VALLSLLVRIPLILLPGPGRDESAYYYWAQHAQVGYASLLLALVRILETLGVPALAAIRIPSSVGGVLCIALFDRLLKTARVGPSTRFVALLALALNPWQVLVGSVLHPDTLFLCSLLALALAIRARRPMWAAVWGAAAALAKPTGIVLLPVVAIWLWSERSVRVRLAATGVLLVMAAPAVMWLSSSMLGEILEFGHLDHSLSLSHRFGIAVGGLLLEGGLLLPLATVQGLGEGIQRFRRGYVRGDAPIFAVAATLIILFLGAAVLNDQIKGSWFLPAFVLLWPSRRLRIPRPAIPVLLLVPALTSVMMVGAMRLPDLSARVETALGWDDLYLQRAGTREERVSSTRTFSERFLEFQDLSALGGRALQRWQNATGQENPPHWIVSDDYGLAAQLAYQWRSHGPGLLIPGDGLFDRGADELGRSHVGGVLVVAVRTSLTGVWSEWGSIQEIGVLRHPVTNGSVRLGVSPDAIHPATKE